MGDFDFGTTLQEELGNPEVENIQQTNEPQQEQAANAGLSKDEVTDPNKIVVTIADSHTPLIVMFGPATCGKTMTLVRLTRYLQKRGYTIKPVSSFRPAYDKTYSDLCSNFNVMINSEDAAKSTNKISFMLVQVHYQGKPICQILESPGEYYFRPDDPNAKFPKFVNAIINSNNRKIWAIMVEPDNTNEKMDVEARRNYVGKIHSLKSKLKPQDKVMFVFNKVDETPYVISPGNIKYNFLFQYTMDHYPNIFVPFKNVNPLTKWFKPNNFDYIAFQTGDFNETSGGGSSFQEGNDVYPQKLWNLIMKRVRG